MVIELVCLALALVSNASLANTREQDNNRSLHKISDNENSDSVREGIKKSKARHMPLEKPLLGSSETSRQDKTLSLTVEGSVWPLPYSGASVGYHLTSNQILEAGYAESRVDDRSYERIITSNKSAFHLKSFWGNSFYTNIGVSHRTVDYSIQLSEIDRRDGSVSEIRSFRAKFAATGLDFSIGNRWQWQAFSLGCDWVGIVQSIATTGEANFHITGSFDPQDVNGFNEHLEDLSKRRTIHLLNFYFGLSF